MYENRLIRYGIFQGFKGPHANSVKHLISTVIHADMGIFVLLIEFAFKPFGIFTICKSTNLKGEVARIIVSLNKGLTLTAIGGCRRTQSFNLDFGRAGSDDSKFLGRRIGEVNNSASHKRSSVVDPHLQFPIVFKIMDPNVGAKRQGFVSGRHGIHIIDFSVGCFFAVKVFPVPGSEPALTKTFGIRQRLIPFAKDFIGLGMTGWPLGSGFTGCTAADEK